MELKVWCDGIQRVVCGASTTTTCQDIVFALAHATGQTGRFILIEKWRNNERVLAPNDRPLASLAKWGEYSNDVSFVMKRSGDVSKPKPLTNGQAVGKKSDTDLIYKRKELASYKDKQNENRAKSMSSMEQTASNTLPLRSKVEPFVRTCSFYTSEQLKSSSHHNDQYVVDKDPYTATNTVDRMKKSSPMYNECIYASISKCRPRQPPPYQEAIAKSTLVNIINTPNHVPKATNVVCSSQYSSLPKQASPIVQPTGDCGKGKTLTSLHHDTINLIDVQKKTMKNQERDIANIEQEISVVQQKLSENEFIVKRYKDEMELLKQLWVEQEMLIEKLESENMEPDLERLIHEGKEFEEEMKEIKHKLTSCENEVGKCREEICRLMDKIDDACGFQSADCDENSNDAATLERLRASIQDKDSEIQSQKSDLETLNNSIERMDKTIEDKSNLIDQLVVEIKEANVEGLTLQSGTLFVEEKSGSSSSEQSKSSGSNRKISVSPHELGNTVPTKKNPDGIWV